MVYIMYCLNYFNHEAVIIELILNQKSVNGIGNVTI